MFNPLIICGFTVWFLSWNITARCKILIVTDPLNYMQDIVRDVPPLMFFLNLFNLNLNKTQRMCQAVNYADFKDNQGELYLKVNKDTIELEIKLIVFKVVLLKDTREHLQCRVYLKAL